MAELSIIFKGSAETKAAVDEVAGGLKGVGAAADEASGKGGGLFSNLLSTAGGFLAANVIGSIMGQLAGFAADSFSAAREAQALMAQTEQVIETTGGAAGMTAEQVADLASSLSAAAGKSLFGDGQVQAAENVLIKYKELKGAVPNITQLSVDMAQLLPAIGQGAVLGQRHPGIGPEQAQATRQFAQHGRISWVALWRAAGSEQTLIHRIGGTAQRS